MTPMLICLPFWHGDKDKAYDICKIIAGLQPHHVGPIAHVLLVARQDCHHEENMIKIVMAKFNTFTHVANSPLRGWPQGPNGMFADTMIHIANNGKNKYECIYWLEPDAVPICPNWFVDLLNEWRTRHPKALVVGCRGDAHGDGTGMHVTGCALYHPDIARLMPELTRCSGQAWDWEHRDAIIQVAKHTPCIENWYRSENAPVEILDRVNVGVRVLHGFKDRSVVIHVGNKFNININ